MSWFQRLARSLHPRRHERDLDREISFHLEMRARENASAGAMPDEAARRALARFGSIDRAKDGCRERSTFIWIAELRQDLRYAARNAGRNPGFTAAAVACLAIGIGANTAVFSFVNAFLFHSTPPRVVAIERASGAPVSYPEFRDWQSLNRVFDDVSAFTLGERYAVGREGEEAPAFGESVSAGYFRLRGATPAAGSFFTPDDENLPRAVLGYRFWRNRYGGEAAVGKTIWINREPYLIAGVSASGFAGSFPPWSTDVWVTPYLHRDAANDRRMGMLAVLARLKPGVTEPQAQAAMNSLDAELARRYPDPRVDPGSHPHDRLTLAHGSWIAGSPMGPVFLVMSALLLAVTGIIFLIACANVAGLLLARALVRRREILIRLSLGASRGRLVRQLLAESLLFGLAGAAAGTALAYGAGDFLANLMPRSITGGFQFQHGIDARVLAFTLATAFASVLLAGLFPALRASDQNLAAAGRSHAATGDRTPRLRQRLIVAQVAASVLVLATAGVFIRSFQKALAVDPGFEPRRLLMIGLDARRGESLAQLKARVEALPGVETAALADVLPLGNQRVMQILGHGDVATATVEPEYFKALGIPLARGRMPLPADHDVVIVNEAFERLGIPLRQTVIGVTPTGRYWSLMENSRPFVYVISDRISGSHFALAIRTRGPAGALSSAVAKALHAPVETGEEHLNRWLEPQRSGAALLGILGAAALGLAITGLYALLAHAVAQRAAELAIRMTLGASRARIAGMLATRSALLIAPGIVLGLVFAEIVARALLGKTLEAPIVAGIIALLAIVSAAATLAPAWRATRIDPAKALRAD
jgi:predicted permease